MKSILFITLLSLSSFSFAAESMLGEATAAKNSLCNAAMTDNCKACEIKNCPQNDPSDRRVKDVAGSGKPEKIKSTTKGY